MAEISQFEVGYGVGKVNAGWRQVMVTDVAGETVVPVIICYPTADPEIERNLGPYAISAAWDGAPITGDLPLVMLSHGSGSSPLVNRDLALSLARSRFVVGMPVHPGDNRDDRSLQGTTQNLQQRPRHLQLSLDALLGDASLFPIHKPEHVALIGHSLGAYTVLALSGGEPRTLPEVWPDGLTEEIPVAHDPRVSALVLLAPAVVWFHAPGSLDAVNVPVLMLAGEQDSVTPPQFHADLIARHFPHPGSLDYRKIAGAGHFSFLSVFPQQMRRPGFPPAHDPPGFDRSAFQLQMDEEIVKFLSDASLLAHERKKDAPSSPGNGPPGD
jgi:predicted dienelactone hydrolase